MNDFLTQLMEAPTLPEQEMIKPNMSYLSRVEFENTISKIPTMSEHDIFHFIQLNLEYIEKCVMNRDILVVNLFTTIRFVRPFKAVIAHMPVTVTRQLCVNKICYDYFTSDYNDSEVKQTLIDATKIVNAEEIKQLLAIGLDIDTACNLAFCRYSSVNEKVNVKRLNFVICCSKDPELMTTQMIVWIYEKLFDRIGTLFITTMLEYYVAVEETGESIEEDSAFMHIMSRIYLAILTFVNNMPIDSIHTLIQKYIQDWDYSGRPEVKVSLRSLSADYSRIQMVVESMMSNGIFVP